MKIKKIDGYDIFATIRWASCIVFIVLLIQYCTRPFEEDYQYLGKYVSERSDIMYVDKNTHEFKQMPYQITYINDKGDTCTKYFDYENNVITINDQNNTTLVYINNSTEYHGYFCIALMIIVIMICIAAVQRYGYEHPGNPLSIFLLPVTCCKKNKNI